MEMEAENSGPVENAWAMEIPSFNKGDMKYSLLEESNFKVAFPKYREKYIRECWPLLQKIFNEHGIKAELDLMEGVMSVATTRKTWDPFIILKARDIIKLIGRSVPVEQAIKVLKDGMTCEIIKIVIFSRVAEAVQTVQLQIKNLVRNKERLLKRRQRLIGANGTALKALELLTECYILVQGCTVSAIGPHKGVQQVMKVVLSTMNNVHPVNLLKDLMVKRTLSKDPQKKNDDWSKYIPKYVSSNVQRKKPKKIRVKKPYTPFPPERLERKVDEQMSSGQYFIEKEERLLNKKMKQSEEKKKETAEKQKRKRSKAFVAPQEAAFSSQSVPTNDNTEVDVVKIKKKVKSKVS